MAKRVRFTPYRPKTVLNQAKRCGPPFWTRYSAYPYLGCQHGCAFCYCREEKFLPHDRVEDFSTLIKAKENAPALLRKALSKVPVAPIMTGDYQPAERKFRLSRSMLTVCHDLGFPVMVLERSPLVLEDLDLLQAIHQRARATVAFSIISAPASPTYQQVCRLENLAPPAVKRLKAMEQIALAGVPVGACMMPLLPELCDGPENLRAVIQATADHGGTFVLSGGLTLSDQQRDYFMTILADDFPDLVPIYQARIPPGAYGPSESYRRGLARQVRQLCSEIGISDRLPRPIIPGDKRTLNKRVAEALANLAHDRSLDGAPPQAIWAARKAAWAIEDLEQELGRFVQAMGLKGLAALPDVGPDMAPRIEIELKQAMAVDQDRPAPPAPTPLLDHLL